MRRVKCLILGLLMATAVVNVSSVVSRRDLSLKDIRLQTKDAMALSLMEIESNRNPKVKDNGDAVGVLQIRPIMVKELNRKLGYNKWKLSDRRDSLKSVLMFKDFIEIYEIETIERASREWNGGPTGMKKSATYSYYKKAKSYYSVYRNKTYGQLSLN